MQSPPPTEYFKGIQFNPYYYQASYEPVTRIYVDTNFLKCVGYAYSRAIATTFSGSVTASLFSGSGAGLTNLNASNISGGVFSVNVGGTGKTNLTSTQILVGNNTNPVTQSGNLTWDNSLNILNASNISGNGSRLTNLNVSNVTDGTLVVSRGGTGASNFTAGRLLLGNGTSSITENGNLTWDNANNTLAVTGDINILGNNRYRIGGIGIGSWLCSTIPQIFIII
jgi:hypothetical protein